MIGLFLGETVGFFFRVFLRADLYACKIWLGFVWDENAAASSLAQKFLRICCTPAVRRLG